MLHTFNPFTDTSPEDDQQECEIWNHQALFFFALACERISTKMHSIKNIFALQEQENVLSAGLCVHFSAQKSDCLGQWKG